MTHPTATCHARNAPNSLSDQTARIAARSPAVSLVETAETIALGQHAIGVKGYDWDSASKRHHHRHFIRQAARLSHQRPEEQERADERLELWSRTQGSTPCWPEGRTRKRGIGRGEDGNAGGGFVEAKLS